VTRSRNWKRSSSAASRTSGASEYCLRPATIPPDTVLAGDQSWGSDGVSVDANSGALDTSIGLPGYNPNIPGLALTYDSLTADPRPIIEVPHILDPTQSVPSSDSLIA